MSKKLLSAEEARDSLRRKGVSINEWARVHGLSHQAVRNLLYGRNQGLRNDGHKAAVLLGMKEGEIVNLPKVTSKSKTVPSHRLDQKATA